MHNIAESIKPVSFVIRRYISNNVSAYFEAKSIGCKYRLKNKCSREEYIRYKHFAYPKGEICNYNDFKVAWMTSPDIVIELPSNETVPSTIVVNDAIYNVRQTENGYYYV